MKIVVNNKEFDSGKMVRKKFKAYSEVRDDLTDKEIFSDEDLDKMVKALVTLFDNQFTEDDINDDMDVSDIMLNFSAIDFDIATKVNNKAEKLQKAFTKGKK